MIGRERGATLVELLVAVALLGLTLGVLAGLTVPILATFEADPVAADAQQRVRGAMQTVNDAVRSSGSGFVLSADDAPGAGLPVLLPAALAAGASVVSPQPATVTTWHAPRSAAHGRLRGDVVVGSVVLPLTRAAFCASSTPSCGFAPGDEVLLFAAHGRMAVASVREVLAPLDLLLTAPLAEAWPAGATVSAVEVVTYEARTDAATGLMQLTRRRPGGPASPVIDFVRRFDVGWIAASGVPRIRTAPDGTEEPGAGAPAPPPPGITVDAAWPSGENCAFFRDGSGGPQWRGTAGEPSPAPMPLAALGDGPWCPSPGAAVRWDVDTARVVGVRLLLSVVAATATLRPDPGLGLSRRPGGRLVPDLTVDVTLRAGRHAGGL